MNMARDYMFDAVAAQVSAVPTGIDCIGTINLIVADLIFADTVGSAFGW